MSYNFANRRKFRGGGKRNKFGQATGTIVSNERAIGGLPADYKETEAEAFSAAQQWQDSKNRKQKTRSRNRQFESLRYPVARIDTDSDYLEIKVLEYSAPGFEKSQSGQALRLRTSSESLKNVSKDLSNKSSSSSINLFKYVPIL